MAKLIGQIVSVTSEGDLVTDLSVSDLGNAPRDESLRVECDGHATNGLFTAAHGQPDMTFVAFENEAHCVQIAIVGGDASGFLGIRPGAEVIIQW